MFEIIFVFTFTICCCFVGFITGRWWEKDNQENEKAYEFIDYMAIKTDLTNALESESNARQSWENMYNELYSEHQSLLAIISDKSYSPPAPKKITPDEWERLLTDEPNGNCP